MKANDKFYHEPGFTGISVRDRVAIEIAKAIISADFNNHGLTFLEVPEEAYKLADALIAQSNK